MFSRRQPTASSLERRRASVAIACDSFARGAASERFPAVRRLPAGAGGAQPAMAWALTLLFIRPRQLISVGRTSI